jgi:hypothetical protein
VQQIAFWRSGSSITNGGKLLITQYNQASVVLEWQVHYAQQATYPFDTKGLGEVWALGGNQNEASVSFSITGVGVADGGMGGHYYSG